MTLNKLSIIVLSKTAGNLWECIRALRICDRGFQIIIVDDGIEWRELPSISTSHPVPLVIPGTEPFCFARNVNLGIKAAGSDDVILLNDDALLETPYGFTGMQTAAFEHPQFGVVSAATNNTGNPNQALQDTDPRAFYIREEPRMVCFVAVFIPRTTIDKVGLLDESFIGYGYEDDDYCLRVRQARLKIGIFDGCVVDHTRLKPTYRPGANDVRGLIRMNDLTDHNRKIFIAKHGADRLEV